MNDCAATKSEEVDLGDSIDYARGHIHMARLRLRTLEMLLDQVETRRADRGDLAAARATASDVLRRTQKLLEALHEDEEEIWLSARAARQ